MARPVFDVVIESSGSVAIAQVCGPVDSETIELFKEKLDAVCLRQGARVLMDCRDLTYLNSRAIGLLVKYQRSLMVSRGRFALCSVNEKLVRTLELLQLGKSLAIYKTREEGLAALQ